MQDAFMIIQNKARKINTCYLTENLVQLFHVN